MIRIRFGIFSIFHRILDNTGAAPLMFCDLRKQNRVILIVVPLDGFKERKFNIRCTRWYYNFFTRGRRLEFIVTTS